MNLILVLIDSLRYDALTCNGARGMHTENLDQFAREAVAFDNAFAASFPTVLARSDIVTGSYTYPFRGWGPLPTNVPIMSELFRSLGYLTMLVFDTPHLIRHGFHYERGYDAYEWVRGQLGDAFRTMPRSVKMPGVHRMAESALEQYLRNTRGVLFPAKEDDTYIAKSMTAAIKWLEENRQEKFLLVVDCFDPHEPWLPPRWLVDRYDPGYKGEELVCPSYGPSSRFTPAELRHMKALYSGEVTLVDRWFGSLLKTVDRVGLRDKTAILFMSDHGFLFGEHNWVGKTLVSLYDEISHINMMLRLPGQRRGVRSKVLVQPVDIVPTFLDLVGASGQISKYGLQGLSFAGVAREAVGGKEHRATAIRPVAITSNYLGPLRWKPKSSAITDGVHTLIYNGDEKPLPELYHRPSDPGQRNNLVQKRLDVAQRLFSASIDFLRTIGAPKQVVQERSRWPLPGAGGAG